MSQVKDFIRAEKINHLYIQVNVVNGQKILDISTAPEGPNEMKKSYNDLMELNKDRINYNTIGIDTKIYHQLDCDNEEIFNKYFGCFNLKENTPYYYSMGKKLPHYLINVSNLPFGLNNRRGLKWGTDTFCDLLVGQWAWCGSNEILHNSDKPILKIDYSFIKDVIEKSKDDFKKTKQINKENKEKEKEVERKQKKEIKELKKQKPIRQQQAQDKLKMLLNKNKVCTVSKIDLLLLELLPKEIADDRDMWVNIGYVIYDLYRYDYESGLRRFKRFSKLSKKYEESKIVEQYDSFKNSRHEVTMASVDEYLKTTDEGIYSVYKLLCECHNFKFRDQDLANIFYTIFKDEYICAYFKPSECWFKYENGMYKELDGKVLIECLTPQLGEKLLGYAASLEYIVEIYNNLENNTSYDDPDIKYYIESGSYYKQLLKTIYEADDYCNDAKGQENIYKCCRKAFYKHEFLDLINQKLHLLGFGEYVLDTSLIKKKSKIQDLFRKSEKEDYISFKTGMTKDQCINAEEIILEYLNKKNKTPNKKLEEYLGNNKSFAEKYLRVALPHEGQYEYVLTLLSDSIYGKNRQRFCVNMGMGKNMKSVLQTLMQYAFGDYFGTMPPAYITAKDEDKSSSLDSDLYSCKYKRSIWISEPPEHKSLNGSRMKIMAGNDKMKVREIYKKPEEISPQFSIYINCNTTFKLDACSDISLPRRIKFNRFTQYFTKNVDPTIPTHALEDPLIKDNEFLIMLSRSLMKILIEHYIKIDLIDITHEVEDTEPKICKEWKEEFIKNGDSYKDFLDDSYKITKNKKDHVKNSLFYTDYVNYCKNNQYKSLNKQQFFNKLQQEFGNPKDFYNPKRGITYGIKEIEIEEESESEEETEKIIMAPKISSTSKKSMPKKKCVFDDYSDNDYSDNE